MREKREETEKKSLIELPDHAQEFLGPHIQKLNQALRELAQAERSVVDINSTIRLFCDTFAKSEGHSGNWYPNDAKTIVPIEIARNLGSVPAVLLRDEGK